MFCSKSLIPLYVLFVVCGLTAHDTQKVLRWPCDSVDKELEVLAQKAAALSPVKGPQKRQGIAHLDQHRPEERERVLQLALTLTRLRAEGHHLGTLFDTLPQATPSIEDVLRCYLQPAYLGKEYNAYPHELPIRRLNTSDLIDVRSAPYGTIVLQQTARDARGYCTFCVMRLAANKTPANISEEALLLQIACFGRNGVLPENSFTLYASDRNEDGTVLNNAGELWAFATRHKNLYTSGISINALGPVEEQTGADRHYEPYELDAMNDGQLLAIVHANLPARPEGFYIIPRVVYPLTSSGELSGTIGSISVSNETQQERLERRLESLSQKDFSEQLAQANEKFKQLYEKMRQNGALQWNTMKPHTDFKLGVQFVGYPDKNGLVNIPPYEQLVGLGAAIMGDSYYACLRIGENEFGEMIFVPVAVHFSRSLTSEDMSNIRQRIAAYKRDKWLSLEDKTRLNITGYGSQSVNLDDLWWWATYRNNGDYCHDHVSCDENGKIAVEKPIKSQ